MAGWPKRSAIPNGGRFLFDPDNQVPIQISGLDFRKRNQNGSWRRRRPDEILVRNVQSLAVCHEDVKRLEGNGGKHLFNAAGFTI
jgi:hypothetical protein